MSQPLPGDPTESTIPSTCSLQLTQTLLLFAEDVRSGAHVVFISVSPWKNNGLDYGKKQLVRCHERHEGGGEPCKSGHQLSTRVPKPSGSLSPPAVAWLPLWQSGGCLWRLRGRAEALLPLLCLEGNLASNFPAGKWEKVNQFLQIPLQQSPGSPWMVPEVRAGLCTKSINTPWYPYPTLTD